MPTIQFGPVLPVSPVEAKSLRGAAGGAKPHAPASQSAEIAATGALDPGPPPVDAERVTMIRKAVESGTYPVFPARVADAMIAAGLLLRISK